MKITQGNSMILLGIMHTLLGISPFAFGKQFLGFSNQFFFQISTGLSEFPLLNGRMNYENFAAFWFFYFGLLLIPFGMLISHIEKTTGILPSKFLWSYLIIILIGIYMIPFSGMTFLMLPHAIYMLLHSKKNISNETK